VCGLWVSPSQIDDDVSRMFLKFVFGSFLESFGVSPSGECELLLGREGTRFFIKKTGSGCGHKGLKVPTFSSKRGRAVGTKNIFKR
jgi:hypothetical protein